MKSSAGDRNALKAHSFTVAHGRTWDAVSKDHRQTARAMENSAGSPDALKARSFNAAHGPREQIVLQCHRRNMSRSHTVRNPANSVRQATNAATVSRIKRTRLLQKSNPAMVDLRGFTQKP
jgi:hypothetical protein